MAPSRKKGGRAAAAAAAARQQWKVGDLVLAKMKGFPAWPAMVSEPAEWGFSSDRKKLLVYFYGTQQIAFCSHADIEAFTEEKKRTLLVKRQGKGADFVRAVDEIIGIYEKMQKLSGANCIEVNNSNNKQLESSRCRSSRNSPEIRPLSNDIHQSEAVCASADNLDSVNPEEITGSSADYDTRNLNLLNSEQDEKVSILDELRQTSLSATTTTRKRQRDGAMLSSVMQRAPSLRRCRSSSGGNSCKYQASPITGNGADLSSSDLPSNALRRDAHVALCVNGGSPVSSSLPLKYCTENTESNKAAARSSEEQDSLLKSNYTDDGRGLNGSVIVNGNLHLPIKASISKKKRKPNRKRTTSNIECATLDREAEGQVELHKRCSESPNSCKETAETFCKADGDGHLPLVKRARVRMGKSLMEDAQLSEFIEKSEKLELVVSCRESDTRVVSSSPATSPANSSFANNSAVTVVRDQTILKVNKFPLDAEAALPPSKRLHRALKAMSANAAEATETSPEPPSVLEVISNGFTDSLKSDSIESPESNIFHNNASRPSPRSESQEVSVKDLEPSRIPSGMELDCSLTPSLSSTQNKDSKEMPLGASESEEPCTSKSPEMKIQETLIQPCSTEEQKTVSTSSDGISGKLLPPPAAEIQNKTLLPSNEYTYPQADRIRENGLEPIKEELLSVTNSKKGDELLLQSVTASIQPTANTASAASNISGSAKSHDSHSDEETTQSRDMPNDAREVKYKVTSNDLSMSDLTPMKDLIAAAEAKRLLSRSTSFPENVVNGKSYADTVVSPNPSILNRSRGSPQISLVHHRPATDDRSHNTQNYSRSPLGGQRERGGSSKLMAPVEAIEARRTFEALLFTLSRTKDSIGRATRVAIDCAKYGIAGEVIEILQQHLEKEPSLYKRVDLFFLVDSITQFSRSQKGGAGDTYLTLVQSALPRFISAAAPHGNAAGENRKQCLKVLRLWLERRVLAESVLRHHIRELESVNETSFTSSYSRRPSRTERAHNDPIREMEGMFVDEYGSNASFQLQNFVHPRLLEDEGSSDDEKSFEAVTPEHKVEVECEKEMAQTPTDKHRHILEDVDGELEMEDVSPPRGVEASSTCAASGSEAISNGHFLHSGPPLPEDLPPSPPPLPLSPPPVAPPCPVALPHVPQQQFGGTHSQPQSNFQGNSVPSEPYYGNGYGGVAHRPLGSSGPFTSHAATNSGTSFQPNISAPLPSKSYPLQPPVPTVSNQFSYIQAEAHQPRAQSWGNCSFGDKFHYDHHAHGPRGGSFYSDRNVRGPMQHENAERDRFSPSINSGPLRRDKAEAFHPRFGPYSESASNPSHGRYIPPRIANYSASASRSSTENHISRVSRGPDYWRPR